MKRTITLATLAVASTLVLAACADDTTSETPETTATGRATDTATSTTTESTGTTTAKAGEDIAAEHNAADIMFTQMMIPHHQQAVEMSEMLLAKDNIPADTREFAQGVIDAQGPEIDRMNAMLETWGQQPMPGDMGDMGDMGGMGGMGGMMSEQDMAALDNAQGTEAIRLYLEQMTAHHEGAVDMARNAVNNGQNPQTIALAEQVITDQEAEIAEMKQMLANL